MKISLTLDEWVQRIAPKLTALEWEEFRYGSSSASPFTEEQKQALLKYVQDLRNSWDPRALRELVRWSTTPSPRAIDAGLLDEAIAADLATFTGLTTLGDEVTRGIAVP